MKAARQALIKEIIESQPIHTQEELADALKAHGLNVTQATVSRDIKEMHLFKAMSKSGSYQYSTMERDVDQEKSDRLIRMLADSMLSLDYANNIIVIRTLSGSAHVAGEAIDNLEWSEILGTIAGDNTILVIVRSNEAVQTVIRRIRTLTRKN